MKPPLTGASAISRPAGPNSAASAAAVSGPIVEWIATIAGAPATAWRTTSLTCSSSRTITQMMSAARATSATSPAPAAPAAVSGAMAAARTSCTIRPPGQSASLAAIGWPIWPSPTKPTVPIRGRPTPRGQGWRQDRSCPEDLPAVDVDDLPGDPGRVIRQQEQARTDQVGGLAHPLQRQ